MKQSEQNHNKTVDKTFDKAADKIIG